MTQLEKTLPPIYSKNRKVKKKKIEKNEIGLSHWQWKFWWNTATGNFFFLALFSIATFFFIFTLYNRRERQKKRRTMAEYCTNYSLNKKKKKNFLITDVKFWRCGFIRIIFLFVSGNIIPNFFLVFLACFFFFSFLSTVYRYGLWSWDVLNLKIKSRNVESVNRTGRGRNYNLV